MSDNGLCGCRRGTRKACHRDRQGSLSRTPFRRKRQPVAWNRPLEGRKCLAGYAFGDRRFRMQFGKVGDIVIAFCHGADGTEVPQRVCIRSPYWIADRMVMRVTTPSGTASSVQGLCHRCTPPGSKIVFVCTEHNETTATHQGERSEGGYLFGRSEARRPVRYVLARQRENKVNI